MLVHVNREKEWSRKMAMRNKSENKQAQHFAPQKAGAHNL